MSDTKIYAPQLRALLGTASIFCKEDVLESRTVPNGGADGGGGGAAALRRQGQALATVNSTLLSRSRLIRPGALLAPGRLQRRHLGNSDEKSVIG